MTIEMEWIPRIRMWWSEPEGRDFGDNPGFRDWLTSRSPRESLRIMQSNGLDAKQCWRMWRWLGRTDAAPKKLEISLNLEDFHRCFPKCKDPA